MQLPTIETTLAPYAHLPAAVQRAILLVDSHPTTNALTRATRRVLKALMTRAEKDDGSKPIEARIDKLAKQAECHVKTVQRAMALFAELGWLKEMSDGRDNGGKYSSRLYQFGREICRIVRLPIAGEKPIGAEMSDGLYKDLTFKEDHREIRARAREANPKPIELPPELAELPAELEIKDTGIAKLRGLAHEAGYNLAHIVAVARAQIVKQSIKAGRAFRYLEAMIGKHSDYAGRAAEIERGAAVVAKATQTKGRAAQYAHKTFSAAGGYRVRIFDGTAEVAKHGAFVQMLAGQGMQQLYDDIAAGKLIEVIQ